MVSCTRRGAQLTIVARPDHSSTWRNNLIVLWALAIPSLGIATLFALAGAWPILPLAGLELSALGYALYVVNRKLQYRHVLTVDDETITLDKGFSAPCEQWSFRRQATGLSITAEDHPWEGPALTLHDRHERVPLGEFLSRDDTLRLVELLRGEIRVAPRAPKWELAF